MRSKFNAVFFALAVVRRGDRYLLVEELDDDDNRLWYLPAGGVESGEDFRAAAIRESMEEAGVKIEIVGHRAVVRDHPPDAGYRTSSLPTRFSPGTSPLSKATMFCIVVSAMFDNASRVKNA